MSGINNPGFIPMHQERGERGRAPQYTPHPPLVVAVPPPNDSLYLNPDQPIIIQPTANSGPIPTNPQAALDYLKTVSKIFVRQKIEIVELITSFDMQNRYTLINEHGQPIFYALEDSGICARMCCASLRPLKLQIFDIFRNEAIHINRDFHCQGCCCPCSLQEIEVSCPPGNLVGTVHEKWTPIFPEYSVKDVTGQTVLKIKGPLCKSSCGGDIDFKVMLTDGGTEIGKISKTWSGFVQEFLTSADNYSLTVPVNMDVKHKALLIGALFLIDYMYFEVRKNNN